MSDESRGKSLREELGGSSEPSFEIKMLPGWQRRIPDDEDFRALEAAAKKKFMSAHRPEVYAGVKSMLEKSHDIMRQEKVVAYYVPNEDAEDTLWIPGSVSATIRQPPPGRTLGEMVRELISKHGGTPLFGDRRFVRVENEERVRVQGGTVAQTSLLYLTPIPGSKRRRALQFTASFALPVEVDAEDEKVVAMKTAFDVCISTLRWCAPER